MAKKKSTPSKTSRSVLAYDPLAWLDEQPTKNSDDNSSTENAQDVAVNAITSPNCPSTSGQAVDESVNIPAAQSAVGLSEDAPYGFFNDAPGEEDAVTDDRQAADDDPEMCGYGFFDDTPAASGLLAASQDESTNIIHLGAELTIQSVAQCKQLVDETINNGFDVRIDARQLQKIDTAGLQLLYSLDHSLQQSGQHIHWETFSNLINEAGAIIGLPCLNCESGEQTAYGFFDDEANSAGAGGSSAEPGFGFF